MTLRYCVKCRQIVDDPDTFVQEGTVYHNTCRYSLLYFGAERAYLSPKQVLEAYDKTHVSSPLETFQGKAYISNTSNSLSLAILECQDMLKHKPDSVSALKHLLKLYRTQGNVTEFLETADRLLSYVPNDSDTRLILAQHYKAKENYEEATAHLTVILEQDPTHPQAMELMGFIQMRLQSYSQAYTTFMDLTHMQKDAFEKDRLRTILRHLQNEIERSASPKKPGEIG